MSVVHFFLTEPGTTDTGPRVAIECANDKVAMAQAESLLSEKSPGWSVEVWDRKRFIGRLCLSDAKTDTTLTLQGEGRSVSLPV